MLLSGFDILCLGSQDWTTHKNVPQQTMGRLAAANRVLYVNVPRSPLRALAGARGGYAGRPAQALSRIEGDGGPLWLYVPPPLFLPANSLPEPAASAIAAINGRILAALLRRVMAGLGFRDPLLWIYGVGAAPLLGRLPVRLTLFDCIDEFSGYLKPGRRRNAVARQDQALWQGSDLVFAGSRMLLERKQALNPRAYYVPHAADFAHFRTAGLAETPVPAALAALPRPVVGLAGVLDHRVDLAILSRIAERHPDWSIALVGPVWDSLDIGPLRARPNVHLFGGQPVAALPGYIKGFDACMVPYVLDDFTRNIYPLKLHEYLASGKPMVATPVPAIAEHAGLVHIAAGPDAFVTALEAALAEDDPGRAAQRIELASRNTWEHRVAAKSELVLATLAEREAAGVPCPAP